MRKMKDSGVPWIGEIPEEWSVCTLHRLIAFICNGTTAPQIDESTATVPVTRIETISSGVINSERFGYIERSDAEDKYKMKVGDIAFSNINSLNIIGNCAYFYGDIDLYAGMNLLLIRSNRLCHSKYLFFFFNSPLFRCAVSAFAKPAINQASISQSTLLGLHICLPPLDSQLNIIHYLDTKCSRIDSTIANIHTLIDKLKEYKQSVITQAVTKGLDPDAPMKDSGVPWIGEIPKHWEVVRLKRLCSSITDGAHFSPETVYNGIPYITAVDIHGKGLNYANAKCISESDFVSLQSQGCQPHRDDVLLVKDGATTGRIGLMTDDVPCVTLSSVAMLRHSDETYPIYLMYLLMSEVLQAQIRLSMAGSAMPRVTLTKLVKYFGIKCPFSEQQTIADFLDAKCAQIDSQIAEQETLLTKLEAYKKSLIYECVTGKREIQASFADAS